MNYSLIYRSSIRLVQRKCSIPREIPENMNWIRHLIFLLVVVAACWAFPQQRGSFQLDGNIPDFFSSSSEENLFSEKKDFVYNAAVPPKNSNNKSEPVDIEVNLYVRDIEKIDSFGQDVKLQLAFRQEWQDDRLKFDGKEDEGYVTLTNPRRIWTPDTFIGNERHAHFHNLLKPNVLIRIYPSGKVLYSRRLTAIVKCSMDFREYPFDRQECSSMFASYGYTTKEITYSWRSKDPLTMTKSPHSPPFELERYHTIKCGPVETKTGRYDCLRFSLIFKRNSASILLKTYFPAAVFVVLSWLSFWMSAKFVSARCVVLVTTLVSTTLVYYFMVDSLPPVNYTRSMDKWMWTCVAFIFAAIVEFLIVVSLSKKQEEIKNAKVEPFTVADIGDQQKKVAVFGINEYITSRSPETWSVVLDKISRAIFPLAFSLFLVIYFVQVKRGFNDYEGR